LIEDQTIIRPQPVRFACDWQRAIVQECQRHSGLNPTIKSYLEGNGFLTACTFLSTDDSGGPFCFRMIGRPAYSLLGIDWARSMLGRPENEDPHVGFAESVGAQYRAAVEGGEVMHNIVTTSTAAMFVTYSQVLIGWRCGSLRAVLSAVKLLPN